MSRTSIGDIAFDPDGDFPIVENLVCDDDDDVFESEPQTPTITEQMANNKRRSQSFSEFQNKKDLPSPLAKVSRSVNN